MIDCSCGGVYYSVAIVPTSVEIGVLLIAYIEHLHTDLIVVLRLEWCFGSNLIAVVTHEYCPHRQ